MTSTAGQGGFTDLDLFLMSEDLSECLDYSADLQGNGTGDTLEKIVGIVGGPDPVNAKLVVSSFVDPAAEAPAAVPTLDLRWNGAEAVDPPTRAGSIDPGSNFTTGLPAAAAAIDAETGQIEPFSAAGPVELFTTTNCPPGTVKNVDEQCPATPGTTVGTFPGPAWAAADNVEVSGAGGFGSPFKGTSAASPHAAACDALVRQAVGQPASPVAPIRERLSWTAVDIEATGPDTVAGAGVLDCLAATMVSDIALTSQVATTDPAPGDGLVYTLTATNNGPDAGTRLSLAATLPAGVTFASSESGCTADGMALSCPLSDMAPAEQRSFTFEATVDTDAEPGTDLVTTATVTAPFDVNLANNTALSTVTVLIPPPAVDQLAATGSSGWPTLPIGMALLGAALMGLTVARRSQVTSRP